MTTQELESLLQGGSETQRIEIKAACDWTVVSLVKDMLALSNVRDGGHIIIGVEDTTFERQGVTDQQRRSYDEDTMKDQVSAYADPHINFSVSYPQDLKSKDYVVISVAEFEDVPVICKKDSAETRQGVVYYRNRNRRMESAPVSNANDMRDIITRSALRTRKYFTNLGINVSSKNSRLEQELEGL